MEVFSKIFSLKVVLFFLISFSALAQENEVMEKSIMWEHNDPGLEWGGCPGFMPEGCKIAVLHGDPAERNVDIFFKVPANSKIPNHYHTSVERMVLVAGELEVTYEGEKPKTLKVGSYAFGPSRKPHSAKCGDSPCILFIAFEEPLDAIPVVTKN